MSRKRKDYWKTRIEKDEAKAQLLANTYCNRQKIYYKQMIKEIDKYVDKLYLKLGNTSEISRSELWNYESFKALRQEINQQCVGLAANQISNTEKVMDKIVDLVLGDEWKDNPSTQLLAKSQVKFYLNQEWSGESYSNRIYHNCNQLASKLSEEIGNMVVLGKAPDAIKAAVMEECGVSYNVANRLIRTEASYTFNQANLERYGEMGAKGIELIVEPDACKECKALEGKTYQVYDAPQLPIHPYCRCCYIPVV